MTGLNGHNEKLFLTKLADCSESRLQAAKSRCFARTA